ncbi:hypothetical protein JTE90_021146 [Oedothorax gibbosus]|uniref:Uncharacterized protein n=1 Tax=Oedothorax gibbosus TaxID=931172 RepID=A0AAV6U1Z9_9ARAC|nr:hypothetical protein JTE90_021146 [Oedothorax gibbosus]
MFRKSQKARFVKNDFMDFLDTVKRVYPPPIPAMCPATGRRKMNPRRIPRIRASARHALILISVEALNGARAEQRSRRISSTTDDDSYLPTRVS